MRRKFNLQSIIFAFVIVAIAMALTRQYLSTPKITSYTTGGGRTEGISWCVLRSDDRVLAVLIDLNEKQANAPTFFQISNIGSNRVSVHGVPSRLGDLPMIYIKTQDSPIRMYSLTTLEIDEHFTSGGYLKSPIEFCKRYLTER